MRETEAKREEEKKTGKSKFVLGIELFDLFKNLSTLATATQRHWWSGRSIEYGIRLLLTQTSEKPKIKQKSLYSKASLRVRARVHQTESNTTHVSMFS